MSESRNRSDENKSHIKTLRYGLLAQAVVIIALLFLCFYLSRTITIWPRPELSDVKSLDLRSVPETYIDEFANKMWKLMYNWDVNGEDDYKKNIHRYQNYFTPKCRSWLNNDYIKLLDGGDIQYRKRMVKTLVDNAIFDPKDVKKISNGDWKVAVHMNLIETLNASVLKDIDITYVFHIVYFDVDDSLNPWGLAVDCSDTKEYLIKDNLFEESTDD